VTIGLRPNESYRLSDAFTTLNPASTIPPHQATSTPPSPPAHRLPGAFSAAVCSASSIPCSSVFFRVLPRLPWFESSSFFFPVFPPASSSAAGGNLFPSGPLPPRSGLRPPACRGTRVASPFLLTPVAKRPPDVRLSAPPSPPRPRVTVQPRSGPSGHIRLSGLVFLFLCPSLKSFPAIPIQQLDSPFGR
jgi:hypothetical protein